MRGFRHESGMATGAKKLAGLTVWALPLVLSPALTSDAGENVGDLLVLDKLRRAWSIWHETGHKYQQNDWTWSEVIETTVNIYSLEAQARQGHPSRLKERDPETGESPFDLARKKRDFTDSTQMRLHPDDDGEYWVRLVMFNQLRQSFGDGFYPALHRYYRDNPLGYGQLNDQDAQIQAFVIATSTVAGQDLTVSSPIGVSG